MSAPAPHRPVRHFSARQGWINDPNGLVFDGSAYHLFYQYYPDGITHGPMHWGHATSPDLSAWTEQAVALAPDELGLCFSGTGVPVKDHPVHAGLAGAQYLLFYTASLSRPGQAHLQTQCVAMADARLERIEKFAGNPIVPNPGIEDFRDPKVFWHDESGRWIMLVTLGRSIGFYASPDAVDWRQVSVFDNPDPEAGIWECPDLFRLRTPGGRTAWVLLLGLGDGAIAGGSGTHYFIGDFDGTRFTCQPGETGPHWMDYGSDFYAVQSWVGSGGEDERSAIAWMSNWQYGRETPATIFRGVMTLPRRLWLEDTDSGVALRQAIVPAVLAAIPEIALSGTDERLTAQPAEGCYRFTFALPTEGDETLALCLFGLEEPSFTFHRHADGRTTIRFHRAPLEGTPRFEVGSEVTVEGVSSGLCLVDNGLVELGLFDGSTFFSAVHYPDDILGPVSLQRRAVTR